MFVRNSKQRNPWLESASVVRALCCTPIAQDECFGPACFLRFVKFTC
jgi:hypothetical protein